MSRGPAQRWRRYLASISGGRVFRAQKSLERAILRGAPAAGSELVFRDVIWIRDNGKCRLCGIRVGLFSMEPGPTMTFDHILPVAFGGRHTYANIQASCYRCNSQKGSLWPHSPRSTSGWHYPDSRTCSHIAESARASPSMGSAISSPCFSCLFT